MKSILITFLMFMLSCPIFAQTAEEAQTLHDKGRECFNAGKVADGREYTLKALEMRKKLFGEVNEDYITSLNNYALSYCLENNYAKATELQEHVMGLCDRLPKQHPKLELFSTNMGRFAFLNGEKSKAAKYFEESLPLVEKYGEMYENLLKWLDIIYDENNDKQNLMRIWALMEEHNQHELTKPCDEPKCMLDKAQYYYSKGNNTEAKECYLQALAMPMDTVMKIKAYEMYSIFLYSQKDYPTAAEYVLSAANLTKEKQGICQSYAQLTYKAGVFSYLGKQYQQAIDCYDNAMLYYMQQNDPESQEELALCQVGKANTYFVLKDYAKEKENLSLAVQYYKMNKYDEPDYPKTLLKLAKVERYNDDYDNSIKHHKQAMEIFNSRNMLEEYSDAATSLQSCYNHAGIHEEVDDRSEEITEARNKELDKMIKTELEDLDKTKTYLGKLIYARSLSTIGSCYFMKGDYANGVNYYSQYMDAIRDAIRDEFRMKSESERMAIWNDEIFNISELQNMLVTLPQEYEALKGDLAALVYDAELLSKGILLNSSIEFSKVLQNSNNRHLTEMYEKSKSNETEIERLRQSASTDDDLQKILTLQQQNQALQLQLYKECAEFADFTNYISYNWKDVQKSLKDKDVAIEFVAIKSMPDVEMEDSIMALVLTKDMRQPVAVSVCNLGDIPLMKDELLMNILLQNPVWGRLSQYLNGKRSVYFSADGSFNRIAIEYMKYNDKPFSEQFEVYRLSSTKELCYRHKAVKPTKAVLFGNIDYTDNATMSDETKRSLASLRGAGDAGMYADLSNTLREINEIQSILKKNKINTQMFSATEASTEAFRGLSGSKIDMLHVATHGMYVEASDASATQPMKNSLLAFAGANLCEQGILTAADVATMDLRQCCLAVLSACETALGQIGSDGVFGLQRGFKNAGVHTLLMSLRKVDDAATTEMMIQFYQSLMAGQTPNQALRAAQQHLRKNGYDKPEYWASFIVLDGQE